MTLADSILKKFSGYQVFTYGDVRRAFWLKENGRDFARTLSYLKKSGRLHGVVKGVYTTRADTLAAGFAFQPFYYGLRYALTIMDAWTAMPIPELVTLKRVKAAKITVFDGSARIMLHHSRPAYFFGFSIMEQGGMRIPVSDPEKTLIDLFFYKVRLPIQNYSGILNMVERKKLLEYLKAYDGHTRAAVANFVRRYLSKAKKGRIESPY